MVKRHEPQGPLVDWVKGRRDRHQRVIGHGKRRWTEPDNARLDVLRWGGKLAPRQGQRVAFADVTPSRWHEGGHRDEERQEAQNGHAARQPGHVDESPKGVSADKSLGTSGGTSGGISGRSVVGVLHGTPARPRALSPCTAHVNE
jgi:hypothetical protein